MKTEERSLKPVENINPFEILHNYRRYFFLKRRNSFYESRRKQKKIKLK